MASQLQGVVAGSRVAVPCCPTGRIARPCSSGRSSSRPGSRAAGRRPAPPGRLEVACSLNNSAGTTGERDLAAAGRCPSPAAAAAAAASGLAPLPSPTAPRPCMRVLAAVTKPAKLEARDTLRLALPSKGRMAEDTLQLLKARGCSIRSNGWPGATQGLCLPPLRCPPWARQRGLRRPGCCVPRGPGLIPACPPCLPAPAAGLPAERGEAQPAAVRGPHLAAAGPGGLVPARHGCAAG